MESIEVKYNQLKEANTRLEAENKQLKEAITAGKVATAKAERTSLMKEAKLPEPCVVRLEEAFKASTDNAGLKEAINVEAEYIKSLHTVVKHNGAADNTTVTESDTVKMQERQFNAYRKGGMSIEEASRMSGFVPKK